MSVLFAPDVCLPGDPAGWGRWLNGHAQEHEQLRVKVLHGNPSFVIPDYDILSWSDEPLFLDNWLQTHQFLHDALDEALNVTGIDFSLVNLSDEREFFLWLDDHRFTHATYRQILNIT